MAEIRPERIKKLQNLSSGSKLFIELIMIISLVILPQFYPGIIKIPNQTAITICLTLAFSLGVFYELVKIYLEKKDQDPSFVLNLQLLTSVVFLLWFLHLFGRINGPFFLIYLLMSMESALNLDPFFPNIVVAVGATSIIFEYVYLVRIGEIALSSYSIIQMAIKLISLFFMRSYGIALAQKIIEEQEARTKLEKAEKQIKAQLLDLEEKNRFLAALRRLDLIIMEALDLKTFCQKIVDALAGELKCQFGLIGLLNDTENRFYFQAITAESKLAKAMTKKDTEIDKLFLPLAGGSHFLTKTIKTKKESSTSRFTDVFPPEKATALEGSIKAKTFWIYPMVSKGKVLGALVFGWKKAERELSAREKEMMRNVVDQTGIALDNTLLYEKLKESVIKLKRANLRLRELDRMKDEFVSIASHELRTPMTSINNYVWMVLNGKAGKISTKQRFYLDRASLATKRLINLVEDMLTVSRVEGGKLQVNLRPGNLVKLTETVVEEIEAKAKNKKIQIFLEPAGKEPPLVMMDQDRIREVLFNLLDNAIKFTDSGGKISVSFKKKGKYLITTVKDNGRGIAKADFPKLFKKFGRLDRSFATVAQTGGTGLGLYICKQIIDLHRGKIGVKSKLGKGATFSFGLKIAREVKDK